MPSNVGTNPLQTKALSYLAMWLSYNFPIQNALNLFHGNIQWQVYVMSHTRDRRGKEFYPDNLSHSKKEKGSVALSRSTTG